jgi:hypothetical protein
MRARQDPRVERMGCVHTSCDRLGEDVMVFVVDIEESMSVGVMRFAMCAILEARTRGEELG